MGSMAGGYFIRGLGGHKSCQVTALMGLPSVPHLFNKLGLRQTYASGFTVMSSDNWPIIRYIGGLAPIRFLGRLLPTH